MKDVFTQLEQRALNAAIRSSAGNGHDFGFTEDIVSELSDLTPQQVGGLITSLAGKGVFAEPPVKCRVNNSYTVTQFVLDEKYHNRN